MIEKTVDCFGGNTFKAKKVASWSISQVVKDFNSRHITEGELVSSIDPEYLNLS